MTGRQVMFLQGKTQQNGVFSFQWQPQQHQAGIYFVVVKAADTEYIKKIVWGE